MADAIAGSAAYLSGIEVVNDSRTTAYLKNGIKPATLNVYDDCGCSNILALAGCDTQYTTPAADNAPWFDPLIPESAEFAGFLNTEFTGLDSTYQRSITEAITDGATLGRSRFGSRTLTWKGFLLGSSCCGVAYGLRWLGKTLQGSNRCGNNCFGEDLEILVCCPTLDAARGYGPNLICNGDFNIHIGTWNASGNTALTRASSPGSCASLGTPTTTTYSGEGALRAVNPLGGTLTFNTGGTDCVLPVSQTKVYKLAFQIRGDTGSAPAATTVTFSWFNSLGTLISTSVVSLAADTTAAWSLREATATAPIGAVTVRIAFVVGTGATLPNQAHIIDAVSLNQTGFAAPVEAFRTLKSVSLLEGPKVLSQRKMGNTCGGSCGGSTAIEVEFSLVGAQPWLYSAPIPVVNCVPVEINAVPIIGATLSGTISPVIAVATSLVDTGFSVLPIITSTDVKATFLILDPKGVYGLPEIVKVTGHTVGATTVTVLRGQQGTTARAHPLGTLWVLQVSCSSPNCTEGLLSFLKPACASPTLPPTALYSGCTSPDVNKFKAVYITAPRTLWNSLSEVVPVITIQTGGFPVIEARIGFFTSADGNPCGDLVNTPPSCDLICDTLDIITIPGNSKFYIDGRTKKMSLVCGTNSVLPGEPFTLGPFSWPSFSCYGFCMEFSYNQAAVSTEDLCVSLSLVPRTAL